MLPNDAASRSRLEELYRNEGRWVELAASLEERSDPRLGTAAPDAERPQLLRELAAIYIDKLRRSHDAIDALERLRVLVPADITILNQVASLYAEAVATWPDDIDAWAALDELYQSQQRWTELSDVLRRRAALAREPAERSQLLARRGQILLDHLDAPEEAAAALKHARTVAPDD